MKRLIILMCTISALIVAQDAAGTYKLTGVDVLYTFIARYETDLTVTDPYTMGITQTVQTIPQGAPFTTQPMTLSQAALAALGINLNVTLNESGSGEIAPGSFYPDVNTHIIDGLCVTLQDVLPVAEPFVYESNNQFMLGAGIAHPGVNVLGLPGISQMAGQQIGAIGLVDSETFEDFPMVPSNPTICGPDGSCFPFTVGDLDGSGTIEIYPDVNLLGIPEYVPGGAPLTGVTGGFFVDAACDDDAATNGCNAASISPSIAGNTTPNFHRMARC